MGFFLPYIKEFPRNTTSELVKMLYFVYFDASSSASAIYCTQVTMEKMAAADRGIPICLY